MITVRELKKTLEDADDEDVVVISAENAPPWIKLYNLRVVKKDDLERKGDEE
jgi:hypothetical protein